MNRPQLTKAELEREIAEQRRAALVVNARSRKGARSYEEAKRLLTHRGFSVDDAHPVTDPARIPQIVARMVAEGHRLVIVGGGDGTISSAVDALAFRDAAIGVLPLGTANSFARALGIPLKLEDAVEVLLNGRVADIDLGKANDDYFANALAIGLPAKIARTAPHGLKKLLGRTGYLISALGNLVSFKPFQCTITADGQAARTLESVLEVRVANGPYKGGLLAAREANVESHDLVLHVVKGGSKIVLAKVWGAIATGINPDGREVEIMRAAEFLLQTNPAQHVSIDGEATVQTPLRVCVARQALHVLVPRERTDLT